MSTINETEERPAFTWAKLKEFANGLTDEQLTQIVKVQSIDLITEILYASELGDDHYYFIDHEYSCTKNDFDKDIMCDDRGIDSLYQNIEEAIEKEDYVFIPANRIYLFDE